ncbi:AAA family ATPase [Sphingomonas sp. RP10(2022)]|uniref:AAA family ATPase n=1 Tax=Sphingomonas liriopis TaxID=2949094 RepID=A0A9X2I0M8_9SPHN|nr:AAA family ATPase [Sphingomonas liriopis]MCP3735660.1 AAA family ATPase [Sphingomonas liriopis]
MSKIIRLQADNFKKLTVIDIAPGGGVVPIRGRNAQGKSSTLDAIMAALGGKAVMPSRPVRRGEDEGSIRVELDDGVVILRRFTQDGKGDSIEVTNADGFRAPSPQKMLDGLYASVAFDPLAFTRLDAKAQLARLRQLVKLDVDVDALERQIAADYDARRDKNREKDREAARLLQMPTYPDAAAQKVDEAALETQIATASVTNGQIERRRVNREEFGRAIDSNKALAVRCREDILAREERLRQLRQELAELDETIAAQEKQLAEAEPLPDPVDVSEVQAALRAARDTNAKIAAEAAHVAQKMYVERLNLESAELSGQIDGRREAIAASIERANMPVPGLSFGDGEVLFNGLPLDQASSAEQLRVSTAIGMATSPKLRVMLVRDGSLLDDEGERILATLAEENDFQLWVEAVDTSGKVGIVLEDGAVVSIDGEPAPEPEAIAAPKRRQKKSAAGGEPETVVEPASGQGEDGGVAPVASPEPSTVGPDIDTVAPNDADFEPRHDDGDDGDVQPEADTLPWEEAEPEPEPEPVRAPTEPMGLFD